MVDNKAIKRPAGAPEGMVPPFVHPAMGMPPRLQKRDEIDEMSDTLAKDYVRLSRLKMVRDTINPAPPQQQPVSEKVDYSAFFKAMGDINNNMANQLTSMYQANNQAASNPVLQALQTQVNKISDKLENAGRGQVSDMEIFFNGITRMQTMGDVLRKSLGIPDQVKTGVGDLPQMLSLEQIRMQDNQASRQHEEKMAVMKRQWEIEDRKTDRQFNLDLLKFKDEQARHTNANKMFEDILGSVMDGLDLSQQEKGMLGVGAPAVQPPQLQPTVETVQARIKQFPCQVCSGVVKVTDMTAVEATCPRCQTVYGIGQEAMAPEAPLPTPGPVVDLQVQPDEVSA